MLKHYRELMLLSLLFAFAVILMGSARAEEEHDKEHQATNRSDRSEPDNVGSKLAVKTGVITVTNRGYGSLTITADPEVTRISGSGSFAIVAPSNGTPCAKTLVVAGKGGTCTIGVRYTPLDTEMSTARVTLADTGGKTATQETIISVR
ncbi:hypothetical protein [Sideroxydans sp. CL21]|uniref:hypothetical protein n=1 Tax=Sideroxydans sp. CL21 TaxID=2600596 RepID=UPI0024BC69BF|nr:hypothetical protein [Sideroxydans sp. CL21]